MKNEISFPSTVLLHTLTLKGGRIERIYVSPSETLGHALERTPIHYREVIRIEVTLRPAFSAAPLYLPTLEVATR